MSGRGVRAGRTQIVLVFQAGTGSPSALGVDPLSWLLNHLAYQLTWHPNIM
jgi:hypothetical protein